MKIEEWRPIGSVIALLAVAAVLAGAPVLGSEEMSRARTNGRAPAASELQPASPKPRLTREQMEAAMAEAERRRAEAMRPDPSVPESVEDQWGVEVIRVASTADGFWLDFRFRVTDAQKALPLFDSRIKPYVQSDQSGLKLAVPTAAKVGALRTTNRGGNIKPDKIYAIMFANPGRHVKPGQKVSVVIGDFKVEHLTVN